jgi:hypothetical protein
MSIDRELLKGWVPPAARGNPVREALWRHRYSICRSEHWSEVLDGHPSLWLLYTRHYSYRKRPRVKNMLTLGPGQKLCLLFLTEEAGCCFRKFISDNGQVGVNLAWFRNESDVLSSDLLKEAVSVAQERWPGERLYTYVDPEAVQSRNPGYCFKVAGWRKCGCTAAGLIILEYEGMRENG